MKSTSIFSILILLSLFFIPTPSIQAALIPVKKASSQTKKVPKKTKQQNIKKAKFQFKKQKKIQAITAKQQSNHMGFLTTGLVLLSIYIAIAITLIVLGAVLTLPALWLTGILLLAIPFTILLSVIIADSIGAAQYKKKQKAIQEEKESKQS